MVNMKSCRELASQFGLVFFLPKTLELAAGSEQFDYR